MDSKFSYGEIVKILSKNRLKEINQKEGIISGFSQGEDGTWGYAVDVNGECWYAEEYELVSTSRFDKTNSQMTNESIRVVVDATGKGDIIGYCDKEGKYIDADDPSFYELFGDKNE